MSLLVIDASVAAKWLLPRVGEPLSDELTTSAGLRQFSPHAVGPILSPPRRFLPPWARQGQRPRQAEI